MNIATHAQLPRPLDGRLRTSVPACGRNVHWWEADLDARCIRRQNHGGPHFDGLWFFDDAGLRVDGATRITALRGDP